MRLTTHRGSPSLEVVSFDLSCASAPEVAPDDGVTSDGGQT